MRVCVVGTSNTIMSTGFAMALAPQVAKLDRFAMGGVSSVLLPFELDRIDFGNYDICIIDTSINDNLLIGSRKIRMADAFLHLANFIAHAQSHGCRTAIIVLPHKRWITGGSISAKMHASVAALTGSLLFDGYGFIQRHVKKDCFYDNAHLKGEYSLLLSHRLLRQIREFLTYPQQPSAFPLASGTYIKRSPPDASVVHFSSIRSEKFRRINHAEKFTVEHVGGFLCGLCINSAVSRGLLTISGSQGSFSFESQEIIHPRKQMLTFLAQLEALPFLQLGAQIQIEVAGSDRGEPALFEVGDLLFYHPRES